MNISHFLLHGFSISRKRTIYYNYMNMACNQLSAGLNYLQNSANAIGLRNPLTNSCAETLLLPSSCKSTISMA